MPIYLLIYMRDKKIQYFKYFDNIKEKEKYKKKVYHIPNLLIIEDSTELNWSG